MTGSKRSPLPDAPGKLLADAGALDPIVRAESVRSRASAQISARTDNRADVEHWKKGGP